ncbi:MAG: type I DNA topoisomerase [Candidatus Eisenbacteria bacterium]
MAAKQKSLVIVESPAKAKTINRFLGTSYVVKASMGHVRDLPKKTLGVDVDKDFEPKYVTITGKKKTITELKTAAKKAKDIFLAPDMDREGEAIAWHLAALIDKDRSKVKRVIFNEITGTAIKEAFANPIDIDMRKVDAQQARRVLDRLVGYKVSPLLWRIFHKRTSAGRVQSVALRLICEREEEIEKFVAREYWTIDGKFKSLRDDEFMAKLERIGKAKVELGTLKDATDVETDLKQQTYLIKDVKKRTTKRNPRPPYITSTLQQDAARRLGFSARKTMVIAQELYEGIDLGEKDRAGLITYMRTDSTRVASSASDSARTYISETFGEEYIPKKATKFRKGKASQDAHEAVRPTAVERTPDAVSSFLTKDQARVYKLIWSRFVASQMAQALFDQTTIEVEGGRYLFKVTGSVMKFDGFLKVYSEKTDDKDNLLPVLNTGEAVDLLSLDVKRHETQPPPRYTEASLIKELEEKGIGRPSTYAAIITTVLDRGYVEKAKGSLEPTELGRTVLRVLLKIFPDIFDVGFTAHMETELDRVETGQDGWVSVVRNFYEPFARSLEHADAMKDELKRTVEEQTDTKCETCGSPMIKKWGRHGRFLACSAFPECKTTKPLEEEEEHTDAKCPECEGEMIVRTGRYGKFLACKRYPDCKGTKAFTLGIKCPNEGCEGELKEKRTKKGRIFYGCESYPKCKFATWDKPIGEPCPECNYPIMLVKTTRDKGSRLKCPKCGNEAKS